MPEEINKETFSEQEQAARSISDGVRILIAAGSINCRDDIIRHLSGHGFHIVRVTADSITLCAPDEPEETLTLSGYYYSEQFCLCTPDVAERQTESVSSSGEVTERIRRSRVIADGIL